MIERLRKLDSAAVSDALDRHGIDGVATGLKPLGGARSVAIGRAVTVRLAPVDGRLSTRHLCSSAIEAAGSDQVVVVSHPQNADVAGWGGLLQLAANLKGIAGVIVDGPVRDPHEIADLSPPVFARSVTPRSSRGRLREAEPDDPISIGGIPVRTNDLVLADAGGISVIPRDCAMAVLATAEEILVGEQRLGERIRAGESVGEVLGSRYERALEP